MITAEEALKRLKEGNDRFVRGEIVHTGTISRRFEVVERQAPMAIVLGCSDSRVPSELIFDQGLGDLFVVRVAGNVAAPSQIGSVEYAVSELGVRIVIVMGHSKCGAIIAAVNQLENPSGGLTPSLLNLLERIQPSVEAVVAGKGTKDKTALVADVVKMNILATVDTLRRESPILREHESERGLVIIGSQYSLETGKVEFFENET